MIGEVYGFLDQLVFVFHSDGGRQHQEIDGNLSVSVDGADIDTLLLDGKRFHPRAF